MEDAVVFINGQYRHIRLDATVEAYNHERSSTLSTSTQLYGPQQVHRRVRKNAVSTSLNRRMREPVNP